jgi:hypothetical protein
VEEVAQNPDENSQHSVSMNKKTEKDKVPDPQTVLLLAKIFQGKLMFPTKIISEFEVRHPGFSKNGLFKKIRDISEVCFFVPYEMFLELVYIGLTDRK